MQVLELPSLIGKAILEGGELVLNVGVGYDENSSIENEDSENDDEGVHPFVGRGR